MKKIISLIALIVLTGCASKPPAVVDTTPKNPTAVFNAKGAINGFVFPDSTFTEVVYTRKDKRTIATDREYDSWMARKFMGNSDDTVIFRLDKNLRWTLFDDGDNKKYLECPLSGCALASLEQFDVKQDNNNEDQFDYDPNDEAASACPTHMTKNTFKVTATGKTRDIAGYNTKEYRASWLIEFQDGQGRKDNNRLDIVFWNTEPSSAMKEVWSINEEATQAYRKKVKQENNSLANLIPDNIFMALSAFSGDTAKDNKKWNTSVTRELAKAKGYPMSIKMEWYLDRKACPQAAEKKESLDWSNPLEAMKQSASNMAGKEAEKMFMPNPNEPIFRYVYEVTGVEVKPVHDSVFEIPAGFTLVNRE